MNFRLNSFFVFSMAVLVSNQAFALPTTSRYLGAASRAEVAVDMTGIVRMGGCSASLVSLTATVNPNARAVVLSNGHCYGLQDPGTFAANVTHKESMGFYLANGKTVSYSSTRVLYSTMTGTDITLFEMNVTYGELAKNGISPYFLASVGATVGTEIQMISGYFNTSETCKVEHLAYELHESQWQWSNSYAYTDCHAYHGTSGSPLISTATRQIVGINNTHQDNDEQCTLDNPCEIDAQGKITILHDMSYGQQTSMILGCVNADGAFDLKTAGCSLLGAKSEIQ